MLVCGVDPGLQGGLAFLQEDETLDGVCPMPLDPLGEIDAERVHHLLVSQDVGKVFVEHVTPFPTGSRKAAFTFGRVFESIISACKIASIQPTLVYPIVWKKAMLPDCDHSKHSSIAWVQEKYPACQICHHDGVAEAVLIGLWGLRFAGGAA